MGILTPRVSFLRNSSLSPFLELTKFEPAIVLKSLGPGPWKFTKFVPSDICHIVTVESSPLRRDEILIPDSDSDELLGEDINLPFYSFI